MEFDRCESCGCAPTANDDIVGVQRVYLVPPADGSVGAATLTVLDDIEAWCFVCRTMYPHEPVTAE